MCTLIDYLLSLVKHRDDFLCHFFCFPFQRRCQIEDFLLWHPEGEVVYSVLPQRQRTVVLSEYRYVPLALRFLIHIDITVSHHLYSEVALYRLHLNVLATLEISSVQSIILFLDGHETFNCQRFLFCKLNFLRHCF